MGDSVKKKNKFCSIFKKILLGLFFGISLFSITSCQSTNETESYIDTNIKYSCDYDYSTNKTYVRWQSSITNNTIYNISSINVSLNIYYNGTKIGSESGDYDIQVKHGETETISCYFFSDHQIDKVTYKRWYCNYSNVWDTYKPWWIAMIVIASVFTFAYILVLILMELDLDDILFFIEEHLYVLLIFLPVLIIALWGIISSNWVPVLIVVGGVLSFIVLALLAHLILFIINECTCSKSVIGHRVINNSKKLVKNKPDKEKNDEIFYDEQITRLVCEACNLSVLKEYCRENKIKGYSSLTKSEIIDLILSTSVDNESSNNEIKKIDYKNKGKVTFNDIAGLSKAKEAFNDKIILPFKHPELFEKYGKKAGGGILLYGLPGTGKTMFAEAASNELDALFIPIKCSDIKSKWYGESEQNIKKIFAKAKKAKRSIIFFDEFEAIGSKRSNNSEDVNNTIVPEILAEMQGIGSNNGHSTIMVIAATNKPRQIDSAFLRPGRFDEKIYIPLPDFEARIVLFKNQLKDLPIEEDFDYEYLAKLTDGFNGADIKEVCEKLKIIAIKETLKDKKEHKISMNDVEVIKKDIKTSVSKEDIYELEMFNKGL